MLLHATFYTDANIYICTLFGANIRGEPRCSLECSVGLQPGAIPTNYVGQLIISLLIEKSYFKCSVLIMLFTSAYPVNITMITF